jgi:beta-galactosidase
VQTVFADWTPANMATHEESVEVYSNCDEVELLLNGQSLGSKVLPQDAAARVWAVPFAAGSIRAVGKNKGRMVVSRELRTAGKAARVVLSAERMKMGVDWNEVAYVTAQLVDAKGVPATAADNLVQFRISGPGTIVAVDNADNASHEMFQATARRAYQGRLVAIVRASGSGRIVVSGSAEGLAEGSVTIEAAR